MYVCNVCLSVCVYVCMCVCVYVCMYVCIYLSIYLSINESINQAINQSYLYMIYIYISICSYLCIYIHIHMYLFLFQGTQWSRDQALLWVQSVFKHIQIVAGPAGIMYSVLGWSMRHTHTHAHTHTFCAASFNRPLALGLSSSKGFLTKIMNYNDYFYDHIFIIIYQHKWGPGLWTRPAVAPPVAAPSSGGLGDSAHLGETEWRKNIQIWWFEHVENIILLIQMAIQGGIPRFSDTSIWSLNVLGLWGARKNTSTRNTRRARGAHNFSAERFCCWWRD